MADMDFSHSYRGPYVFSPGSKQYYYIHRHAQCIGLANMGSPETEDTLIKLYNESRDAGIEASKLNYRILFTQSLSKNSRIALGLATDGYIKENTVKNLNTALAQAIANNLQVGKLQHLMDQQRALYNSDIFSKIKMNQLDGFNKLLEVVFDLFNYIKSSNAINRIKEAIFTSLENAHLAGADRQTMGLTLQNELANFIKNKNLYSNFELQQMKLVISKINGFTSQLINNYSGKDHNPISQQSLKDAFQGVFSQGFAEAFLARMQTDASTEAIKFTKKILKGKTTGQTQVVVTLIDTSLGNKKIQGREGSPIGSYGKPEAGKADDKFNNVSFIYKETPTSDGLQLSIDIGLSSKFYRSLKMSGVSGTQSMSKEIHFGSGSSLFDILYLLAQLSDNYDKYLYLSFNTLAHYNKLKQAVKALKQAILARNIVNMAASRGGKEDFAQFMVINNQVISIWDIILQVQKDTRVDSLAQNQAIKINFPLPDQVNQQTEEPPINRVKRINAQIYKSYIKGTLKLNKLAGQYIHSVIASPLI